MQLQNSGGTICCREIKSICDIMGKINLELLTPADVMKILRISQPTLYLWLRQGKLKAIRIGGGQLRFLEEEIMKVIGKELVPMWIAEGKSIEEARMKAHTAIIGGIQAFAKVEYLSDPTRDIVRVRVAAPSDAKPYGLSWNALADAKRAGSYVFLGAACSIWKVDDLRAEEFPGVGTTIVIYLKRISDTENDKRKKVEEAIKVMKEGNISGKIEKYNREDLHERGSN